MTSRWNCIQDLADCNSQIRQTWQYKVAIARTYTMLQMHIFSLEGTNTYDSHGKDVRVLEHDYSISSRFSEWRRQLVQTCGMQFTSDACRCDL